MSLDFYISILLFVWLVFLLIKTFRDASKDDSELFDPKKSFFGLYIVRKMALIIVLISLFIFISNIYLVEYSVCFKARCFNDFFGEFKFSIGILSLLIPIGALFAAQHRSELMIAQIETSEKQNIFTNHYKHIDEFEKYVEKMGLSTSMINERQTYFKLFPESRKGIYEIPKITQKYLDEKMNDIYNSLVELERYDWEIHNPELDLSMGYVYDKIDIIHKCILSISNRLGLVDKELLGADVENYYLKKVSNEWNISVTFTGILKTANLINLLCNFCENSNFDSNVVYIALINFCSNQPSGVLKTKEKFDFTLESISIGFNSTIIEPIDGSKIKNYFVTSKLIPLSLRRKIYMWGRK